MAEYDHLTEAKGDTVPTHTPGPWRYWMQRRPESEDTCTFRNQEGAEVLRAVTVTLTEADARLIAAAPELLEALRPFANYACPPGSGPCACHNCIARDVIAKALGTVPLATTGPNEPEPGEK